MTLSDQLQAIREKSRARIPAESRAIMERAVDELRRSGALDRVVKVGERAPRFTLPTASGRSVDLPELLGRGPVVLSFFRGRWWPYCVAELEALQNVLSDITHLGASLVVISPQIQRTPREPETQEPLAMEHLYDRGNEVAERYGLAFEVPAEVQRIYRGFGLDLAKANGDDSWTLPMPARFVVDRAGVIQSSDVDPDYTRRTEPSATLAVLRSLTRWPDPPSARFLQARKA